MQIKKHYYINYFFKLYKIKIQQYFINYYIFIINSYFKFFLNYLYLFKVKNKIFFENNIFHKFKLKNNFIVLDKKYYISNGILSKNDNKKKKIFFYILLQTFLKNIIDILNGEVNIVYLNINKKILISFNIYTYYFFKLNNYFFEFKYFNLNNIFLKEKQIYGYMKTKKTPRKKKFLTKKLNKCY